MSTTRIAPRRPSPCVADVDEAVNLEQTLRFLCLALDGLEARATYSMIEKDRDIVPLARLAADAEADMIQLRVRLATIRRPRPRPVPSVPAELAGEDRR